MKTKHFAFITAAAMTLVACNGEGEEKVIGGSAALQVTSGIETRASGSQWTAGDAIGIYSLDGQAAEYENRQYRTATGGMQGTFAPADESQTVYFPMNGDTRGIIAYYPYSESVAEGVYAVNVSDQSDLEAIDLMTSALVSGKHKDDPKVALTFSHKLSGIAVRFQPGDGLTAADLEGLTLTLTGQTVSGTIDVTADGSSVIPSSGAASEIALKVTADGTSAEGIVLPASSTEGMSLVIRLPGHDALFTWAIANAEKSQSFEEGKKYAYTITINRIGVDVTAEITDWTAGNGEGGENGSAE